jgi:hypothetical protein
VDLNVQAFFIGVTLALAVSAFATITGLDRDRAFYATVMIVIALLYDLFAAIGGSTRALLLESTAGVAFVGVSVLGFKRNLWWVAAALAAHGIFDFVHGGLIANPGVPAWWPAFCGAYDVVAAGYLAVLLKTGRRRARPA